MGLLNVTKDVNQKENQEFQKENQEFQEENHNQKRLENVNVEHLQFKNVDQHQQTKIQDVEHGAQCNKRCSPKRKPQPRRRKPRVPKRRPQPRRKPQPKKIGKCECRALAIQKCGSRGTNRQTRCRNAYIAQCNKRCQPKRKPQPRRRKPRVPKVVEFRKRKLAREEEIIIDRFASDICNCNKQARQSCGTNKVCQANYLNKCNLQCGRKSCSFRAKQVCTRVCKYSSATRCATKLVKTCKKTQNAFCSAQALRKCGLSHNKQQCRRRYINW